MNLLPNLSHTSKRIVKALNMFGSVQVLSVLCSVVRVKVVAVLLGPVGIAIYSIFWQTVELLRNVGGMNISTPTVKEIIEVRSNPDMMADRIRTVRRLAGWLGILTTAFAFLASPLLSWLMFRNTDYTLWFLAISPIIALSISSIANNSILQAREELKSLAMLTLWTSVTSSALAVLCIWLWGLNGIIPALLVTGLVQYLLSWYYSERRPSFSNHWRKIRRTLKESRSILSMGGYVTISLGISMACTYAFTIYLNRLYGSEILGVSQAGYTMLNAYVGTFFLAMSMEYYPRLSRQSRSPMSMSAVVNHEILLILKILIPLVVLFVALGWLLVRILYTSDFDGAVPLLMLGAPGILFRALSTSLAYTILAKGDGRTYIVTETLSSVIGLALNILGYELLGFAGIGIGYTIWYGAYTIITFYVYRRKYKGVLRARVWWLLFWGVLAVSVATVAMFTLPVVTFR